MTSAQYSPATPPPTASQYSTTQNAHYALGACGLNPSVDPVSLLTSLGCDLADGALYALESNWTSAGLSVTAGLAPSFFGGAAGTIKLSKIGAEGVIKSDELIFSSDKIVPQMAVRGWNEISVKSLVSNPYTTRVAKNKSNGNPATVFYAKDGTYVSVDNISKEVIQITDNYAVRGLIPGKTWYPDSSIINPYTP